MDWAAIWKALGAIASFAALLLRLQQMFIKRRSQRPEMSLRTWNKHSQYVWICLELRLATKWAKTMKLKHLKAPRGIKLALPKTVGSNLLSPDVSTSGRVLDLDIHIPAISRNAKIRGGKIIFFAARDKLDNDTDFIDIKDAMPLKLTFASSNWWWGRFSFKVK